MARRRVAGTLEPRGALPARLLPTMGGVASRHGVHGRRLIDPGATVQFPMPEGMPKEYDRFRQDLKMEEPPVELIRLDDVGIAGSQCDVVMRGGVVAFPLAVRHMRPRLHGHGLFYQKLESRPLPGRSYVLASYQPSIYFHWLYDTFCRLAFVGVEEIVAGYDRVLVSPMETPYQREMLEIALGGRIPLVEVEEGISFQCERVDKLTPVCHLLKPTRRQIEYLRDLFLPRVRHGEGYPPFLYVSRNKNRRRRIRNEEELLAVLEPRGFRTFHPEDHGVLEQIAHFAHAQVIVAPHGGGLSNLFACRNGARVLELFSPKCVETCFYTLSHHCGLRYTYLVSDIDPGEEGNFAPITKRFDYDIVLSERDLEQIDRYLAATCA